MSRKLLLTICIPTYNRPGKIIHLLDFLYHENKKIDSSLLQVEFIVGDNSPGKLTEDACINSALYKEHSLKYIKNPGNLGLIGNVLNLAGLAKGEYVWVMGDDDDYHDNIFTLVQQAVLEDDYSFIFINHRGYFEGKRYTTGFESAIGLKNQAVYEDGKVMALEIWNFSETSLMYISACVFSGDSLKKCLGSKKKKDLGYPLFISFFCAAQGKARIIEEICIDNIWGTVSWSNSTGDVFFKYVPNILYSLPNIGYDYLASRKILLKYIRLKIKGFTFHKLKNIFKKKV